MTKKKKKDQLPGKSKCIEQKAEDDVSFSLINQKDLAELMKFNANEHTRLLMFLRLD